MTDQQSYDMLDGTPMLTIERQETTPTVLLIRLPIVSDHDSVAIASRRLLAMIDTADPDAMRGYLRERSDYLDSPDELPIIERRLCDPIPEADPPEDTDERTLPLPVKVQRALDHSAAAVTAHAATLDNAAAAIEYVLEIRGTIR